VFSLAAALALAAQTVNTGIPALQSSGAYVGATVSGTFLWIIGILNLLVLADVVRILTELGSGAYDRRRLEQRLLDRGLLSRLFLGKLGSRIRSSWQMYPLGLLFGLGFDTETEVGMLGLAAGVATHEVPFPGMIALPLLFAAGMSLIDTADGALMTRAYGWAVSNPARRIFYNLAATSVSVAVVLTVGTIELLQVGARTLALKVASGASWPASTSNRIGYGVAAVFVLAWLASVMLWKAAHLERRWKASFD
jgi:nickel/cobalt transporter (NiCoT) family protein